MIALLTGRVAFKAPTHLILDVHGVGYEIFIPLSTFYSLPNPNDVATLHIHTHLREDAIQLYGFLSALEKEAFLLLTGVSGIGPKLGLSILSALSVTDLFSAIQAGDVEKLATVPGIGKKSAARLALELKDKVMKLQPGTGQPLSSAEGTTDPLLDDAFSALVNLGYRAPDVKELLKRLSKAGAPGQNLQEVIREALKHLARG